MNEIKTNTKPWAGMSAADKAIFVMKAVVTVFTFGLLCGNTFVEGMEYNELPMPK